jgi:D-glycero-D-manno-heptose 1,7-bisphosphate phosphatase
MKLLILDRDGTINALSRDGYVASPDDWHPIAESLEAIARLNQSGWRVVVASNQPAVGRGQLDMATLNAIHAKMHKEMSGAGAKIDAVFFCPHTSNDMCNCRKPQPGLFHQIAQRTGASLQGIPAAGDSLRDAHAAIAAGCQPHLLLMGQSEIYRSTPLPSDVPANLRVHHDLSSLADWLISQSS